MAQGNPAAPIRWPTKRGLIHSMPKTSVLHLFLCCFGIERWHRHLFLCLSLSPYLDRWTSTSDRISFGRPSLLPIRHTRGKLVALGESTSYTTTIYTRRRLHTRTYALADRRKGGSLLSTYVRNILLLYRRSSGQDMQ